MARVSFSALIEEIVGKMAGSVFQDSYGGMQIRTRVTPRNPQTNYQQLRRGEFGYISALWRSLTSVQRQSFIGAASTPPEALNLFIRSNVNLSLINEAIIDTYVPSSTPDTVDLQFTSVTPTEMFVMATGAITTVPAGTKLLVQVTAMKPPTRIFTNPSMYSPVISFDEGTDLSVPTDIFSEWQSRYGVLLQDKRLCLKANLIDKSNGNRGADTINCTETTDMTVKYIPLFATETNAATTGTTLEDLYTYSVPANTLLSTGDRLDIYFQATFNNNASNKEIGGSTFGQTFLSNPITGLTGGIIRQRLYRTGSTTARLVIEIIEGLTLIGLDSLDLTGIDFTTTNDIIVRGRSGVTGNIVGKVASVDLIKAP